MPHRGVVVQFGMRPPGVVEIYPMFEPLPQLAAGFKCMQVNAVVFQGTPKTFDHDVIHPALFAIHGDLDGWVLLEGGDKFFAGE